MKQEVIDTILNNKMINKGDSIVIGFSGGADSVCLTLILKELISEFDITLKAVHINHKIRGEEADRDMYFCENFCKMHDIEFVCNSFDVIKLANEQKMGVEEFARKLRYEVFEKHANGGKIATAHNLNDVAETLLFNITRGTSVKGLCSIPPVRDNIIRPLINCSREEIEAYLKSKGQDFVTDSTNLSTDYTRNKFRHNVIPQLTKINPQFLASVSHLVKSAEMQSEFIKLQAEKLIENEDLEVIKQSHKAVIYEYIALLLKSKCGITPDLFHIEQCMEIIFNGGKCSLPKGFSFENKNEKIRVFKESSKEVKEFEFIFENEVKTPYNKYNAKIISIDEFKNNQNVYNLFLNDAIDYDRICHSLTLRSKKSGDRIFLKKRRINKLLKAVYTEKKIPLDIRDRLAVLESDGKIVWAEQIGVSEDFCVTKNTKTVLLILKEVDYH